MQQLAFDGVAGKEQARAFKGTGAQQAKRAGRPGLENSHALAHHAGADHEVQFVHQAIGKQGVPKNVAAAYQDLPPRLLFERCDVRVRVCAPHDAGRAHSSTSPGFRLFETTTFSTAALRRDISRSTAS